MHFFLFTFIVGVTFREGSAGGCTDINLTDDATVFSSLGLSVTCGTTTMTATIDTCALQQMEQTISSDFALVGYNASVSGFDHSLSPGSTCRGTEPDSETLTIVTSFYGCVTDMIDDGTHIIYSNAVRTIAFTYTGSGTAVRRKNILLPFSCMYSKVTNESSAIILEPSIGADEAAVNTGSGSFGITVNLCRNSDCSTPYSSGDGVVALVDLIYVEVSTTHSDLIIEVLDIWATKTSDPNEDPPHMLLLGGCSDDPPYVTVISNRVDNKAVISFRAFDWVDEAEDMYIHVEVSTCDNTRDHACVLGAHSCAKRKRRNVHLTSNMGQIITTTAGHLTITH